MATITAELALEVSKFQNALKTARSQVGGFKGHLKQQGGGMGEALFGGMEAAARGATVAATAGLAAAVAAVVGTAAGLKGAFDLGGTMKDAADRIGTVAGRALVLTEAFKRAGLEAGSVESSIAKMQKNIAEAMQQPGGDKASFLKSLGLDATDLANMDSADAFEKIGTAIAGIQNPTLRTQAAMELFGKSGAQLLNLFRDGGAMDGAKRGLGAQAKLLTAHAEDFDKISDVLGSVYNKLQGFFVGLGSKLVDYLLPVTEWFDGLDLASYGQQFGDAIVTGIEVARAIWQTIDWRQGLSLIGDTLMLAFKESVNLLAGGLLGSVQAFAASATEAARLILSLLAIPTTSAFWQGMGHALMSVALLFNEAMLNGIGRVLEEAKKIPGIGLLIGNADANARTAANIAGQQAAGELGRAGASIDPLINGLLNQIGNAGPKIADAFARGMGQGRLMDTSGEMKRIAEAAAAIMKRFADNKAAADAKAAGKASPATAGVGAIARGSDSTRLAGGFASAVNLLMGRSPNELILDENKKQSELLAKIEKNTTPKSERAAPREARPIDMTPRFA